MASLVSLVMTDIVDSTRRWAADEAAMAVDLEAHDRLLREVVGAAGGTVFKHTGDGMIAVFDDPVAATGAAAAAQRTVGTAAWQHPDGIRIRAAAHTGVVHERDGDMFGTAVNRLARLLGTCPAGAVLVSSATASLLTDRAPAGLDVCAVGAVALTGFATPEQVHALVGDGLAAVAEIAPVEVPLLHLSLPPIDDELVGRTDELAAIWDALDRSRLITLFGVGGMGKTRLALEVAAGAVEAFSGNVWWIDLSAATADSAVAPVTLAAVGAREAAGRTLIESVCDHLRDVTGMVVFDNCEHVIDAAREMVGAVRAAAPGIRLVVTSREALGLRSEHLVAVGSLPTEDGTQLFGERARAVRPDLDLATHHDVVERICAQLDGIPLALELAAARCRSLTPAEVERMLSDRFRLLRGGRTGAERHRTLRAAVDWSYALLDSDERAVFDRMAVFAGGTLIDGLMAVTGLDEFDAVDVVDRLVSRSMVVATATPLGTRYHQLETLRQYAEDRLMADNVIDDTRDRHLAWTESFTAALPECAPRSEVTRVVARFAAEIDNLRVAVAHAIGTGRHTTAQRMVAAAWRYAYCRPVWEMFDWIRPLDLREGWTDEAAICAATATFVDYRRGRPTEHNLPIGGVPERFLVHNAVVMHTQSLFLRTPGGWRSIDEALERFEPSDDYGRLVAARSEVFNAFFRSLDEDLDAAEVDQLVALGTQVIDMARRRDDPIDLTITLFLVGFGLAGIRPDLAITVTQESLETAQGLGCDYLTDYTPTALAYIRNLSPEGGVHSVEALTAVRNRLAVGLERKLVHDAGILSISMLPAVAAEHPDAVKSLRRAWKHHTGIDLRRTLARAHVDVDDDTYPAASDTALAMGEAVAAVIAALDAMIAARVGASVDGSAPA